MARKRSKSSASKKYWFQVAVLKGRTRDLVPTGMKQGWSKRLPAERRRKLAVMSRPKNWPRWKRYLSAARALQALANVTRDPETKRAAKADADYLFKMARKIRLQEKGK